MEQQNTIIKKEYVIMRYKGWIIVSIVFLIVGIRCITEDIKLILPIKDDDQKMYGIIDGTLSMGHCNVIKSNTEIEKKSKLSHGDELLQFMYELNPNNMFYYYDAETDKDKGILSESIINGLNWMLENNVNVVSISLSSKYYSHELENWILQNSGKIKIYASYSNTANTFDYPARYERVVGVGTIGTPKPGKEDVIYKTNNLIMITSKLKFYKGNSYLAPYTMIKQNN